MQILGTGTTVISEIQAIVKVGVAELELSVGDPSTDDDSGKWKQSLHLRRGTWTGVDIDLSQTKGSDSVDVEISTASKGGSVLFIGAIVLAIAGAFLSGDPLLRAVGITAFSTNLTVALAALALMFVTVPVAMITGRVIGASGAKESNQVVEKVTQLLQPRALASAPELGSLRPSE
jgi:hypothetical protein